jgi:hypothetical protein
MIFVMGTMRGKLYHMILRPFDPEMTIVNGMRDMQIHAELEQGE